MENSEEKKRKHEEDEEDLLTLSLFSRSVRARMSSSPPKREQQQQQQQQRPIIPVVSPVMMLPSLQMELYVDFQTSPNPPPPQPVPLVPNQQEQQPADHHADAAAVVPPVSCTVRSRRNPTQGPREGKSETIPPPFPWATNRRATVHTLKYLFQNQIVTITGDVQCKRCERKFEIGFDLKDKFSQVWNFIAIHRGSMHDRAPDVWMNPTLPTCKNCGQENSVKPVIAEKKKKTINWLFLLLGQMLGCCTLEQLKYFCKHTKNHRTGAKDRVLYLTYLALCKQLYPEGPFDR